MIIVEIEFEEAKIEAIVAAFLTLPTPLRPTHFGEDEEGKRSRRRVDDSAAFDSFFIGRTEGFFLFGPSLVCMAMLGREKILTLHCSINTEPELARDFLVHLAKAAAPRFAFACEPEERDRRNRLVTKLHLLDGPTTIETWVGRNTRKYLPGLYWLTLIPSTLLEEHAVAFSALESCAVETVMLQESLYLFRFYERPESWRSATCVSELLKSVSGIFDIKRIRPLIEGARSFAEIQGTLAGWR